MCSDRIIRYQGQKVRKLMQACLQECKARSNLVSKGSKYLLTPTSLCIKSIKKNRRGLFSDNSLLFFFVFSKAKNAPRGCILRRIRWMSQAVCVSFRSLHINNWSGGPVLMPAATIRCYTVSSDVPVKTPLPDPAVLPAYSGSDPSVPVPGRIGNRRTPAPRVPAFPVSGHRVPAPALR